MRFKLLHSSLAATPDRERSSCVAITTSKQKTAKPRNSKPKPISTSGKPKRKTGKSALRKSMPVNGARSRAQLGVSGSRTQGKHSDAIAPARIKEILKRLDATYPDVECALQHKNAFELLVATILSAQCTDVRVNMVTPALFAKYPTPEAFAAVEPETLEPDIRSTGFFRNKAKSIVGAARKLVAEYGGKVPDDMDQLLTLPGVARKTANVVLGSWFGKAEGVVVDTHVHRISRRLELTEENDPKGIERDLMQIIPRDHWINFSHQIIWHGRKICFARKPNCVDCPFENLCHAGDKTWSTVEMHKTAKV